MSSISPSTDPASAAILRRIRDLGSRTPGIAGFAGGRPAAVMIPLIESGDGLQILFEQRATGLKRQPGEICFPGGGIEPGENPAAAAVRETAEELCTGADQIQILAELDGVIGPTGAPVWSFAGLLKGYKGTWSANEVAETFTVPVKWLLEHEPEVYMTQLITVPGDDFPHELVPGGRDYPWARKKNPIWFYRYGDRVIWGLTANILTRFLMLIKDKD